MNTHRPIRPVACVLSALLLSACSYVPREAPLPLTAPQIAQMNATGMPAPEIEKRIQLSKTVYRLSDYDIARLKRAGVSEPVIEAMNNTYAQALSRHPEIANWRYWSEGAGDYWYGGYPYGWPLDWS